MENTDLILAAVWLLVAILCLVAVFWNPAHFISLTICVVMGISHYLEWKNTKK